MLKIVLMVIASGFAGFGVLMTVSMAVSARKFGKGAMTKCPACGGYKMAAPKRS